MHQAVGIPVISPNDARRFGPVDVTVSSRASAIQSVVSAVEERVPQTFTFCNTHTVNQAFENAEMALALKNAIVFNDGLGMDIASTILYGIRFPENLNGTDLTPLILKALTGKSVFLVGSTTDVLRRATKRLQSDGLNVFVVGDQQGFFDSKDEAEITHIIKTAQPDLVIVGMGHPRQEVWAYRHQSDLGVPIICVGAYIDFVAQAFARAPKLVRRLRCEWIFRMILEPKRLGYRFTIGNVVFLLRTLQQRWRNT